MKKYKKLFTNLPDFDLEMAIEEEKGHLINCEFMFEAIIRPDIYTRNLLILLDKNKDIIKKHTHPEELIKDLSNLYINHKIIFKVYDLSKDENIMVHHGGNDGKYIFIFCTPFILNAIKKYKLFKTQLSKFLKHEIIHRNQNIKINNEEIIKKIIKKSRENQIEYYSTKQEVMAYAWQIINDFRISGKNEIIIKELITKNSIYAIKYSDTLALYRKLFKQDSSVIKLLFKYMYMYLDKK